MPTASPTERGGFCSTRTPRGLQILQRGFGPDEPFCARDTAGQTPATSRGSSTRWTRIRTARSCGAHASAKVGRWGGVQWGQAVDGRNIYVANSDIGRIMLTYTTFTDADPKRGGGMFALDLATGKQVWHTPPGTCGDRPPCSPAQSGAVSAIPGVAFSGSVDGHLRAYAAGDGKIVWDVDTAREYESVNGVEAWGGRSMAPDPRSPGGCCTSTPLHARRLHVKRPARVLGRRQVVVSTVRL
jgi:hypothetical protein